MMRRFAAFATPLAISALFAFVGCGDTNEPAGSAPAPTAGHSDADGHAHEEGAHAEEGPHHGHLIELGEEEYHAELTHDEASKTVSVYLLGKDAKSAVAIADPEITLNLVVDGKPVQAKLTAAPEPGDAQGQASRFTLKDEAVLEALEAPKTTGRLNVTIAGKSYAGTVEHHEHGEHGH